MFEDYRYFPFVFDEGERVVAGVVVAIVTSFVIHHVHSLLHFVSLFVIEMWQ